MSVCFMRCLACQRQKCFGDGKYFQLDGHSLELQNSDHRASAACQFSSAGYLADMCQDPNHLFLLFQILTKIRKIYYLFLMAFIYPFHVSFNKSKFREKCQSSCRSCATLDPRSEWVFADFHGLQIISSKKSPVI